MAKNKEGRPEWFKFWRRNRRQLDIELLDMESRGIIFTNMMRYFDSGEDELLEMDPLESMAFNVLKCNVDDSFEEYEEREERNRENGRKGGRPRKESSGEENPRNPLGYEETHSVLKNPKKEERSQKPDDRGQMIEDTGENPEDGSDNTPARVEESPEDPPAEPDPPVDVAHKHGQYGWVKLTDDQYSKLINELGPEELDRCITYIDESAQSTSNKNKWKDWNLVVRRCHREGWGLYRQQQYSNGGKRRVITAMDV